MLISRCRSFFWKFLLAYPVFCALSFPSDLLFGDSMREPSGASVKKRTTQSRAPQKRLLEKSTKKTSVAKGLVKRNFHDLSAERLDGTKIKMNQYKGKYVLVVNIASSCGYTGQLAGLQRLYVKYGKGKKSQLEILAFPSNDFNQMIEDGADIEAFCKKQFGVTFPIMKKCHVKGIALNSVFEYLTKNSPFKGEVKWNFEKFLVGPDGLVRERFLSGDDPNFIARKLSGYVTGFQPRKP